MYIYITTTQITASQHPRNEIVIYFYYANFIFEINCISSCSYDGIVDYVSNDKVLELKFYRIRSVHNIGEILMSFHVSI